jgi:NADH-quinone oxidoreductase subunit J
VSRPVQRLLAVLGLALVLGLFLAPAIASAQQPGVVVVDPAATAAEQPAPTGKGTALAFWGFAAASVIGALLTITRKNAVSAVMFLVGTFFAISAIYVMLFAHFMAAIQVLVYAGAIMVLFVFVVMILNKEEEEPWAVKGILGKAAAVGGLLYFLVRMVLLLWNMRAPTGGLGTEKPWLPGEFAAFGSTKAVGAELFTSYLFPFEAISVALLIAIVGAVVLAHPDHSSETHEPGQGGPTHG